MHIDISLLEPHMAGVVNDCNFSVKLTILLSLLVSQSVSYRSPTNENWTVSSLRAAGTEVLTVIA